MTSNPEATGTPGERVGEPSEPLLPAEWGPGLAPSRPAILIVDDDPRNLFALEEILQDLGHEVVRAESGKAALRHVLVRDFAVILLDVQMPEMDGYETAAMIRGRERSRAVPIIFVTAVNTDETHVFRGYSAGAVDYVFKPLNPIILRSKVAVFVDLYLKGEEVKRKAAQERRLLEENYRFRSERLRVEEQLRRQEQLRTLILRSLPLALYTERLDDPSRARHFLSDNIEELFGFATHEFADDPALWRDRVNPDDRTRVTAALAGAIDSGALSTEYRWKAKDGSDRYFLDHATLVRGPDGAPRELMGTVVDVTERRQLEHQLVHAQKMEALGQLTGGIAHDFNNMLSIVIGNLDLIKKEVEHNKTAARRLKSALDGAFRCSNMTQRLLTFARRQPLASKLVDLGELVPGLTELLRRTLGDKVEIRMDCAPDVWNLMADPAQVEAAVINLAINARDAMPDGGMLTIALRNVKWDDGWAETKPELTRRDYVLVSVTDTGTGMSREVLERAFEPFFTTKGIGHGTGLGLSTTYGFVKSAGGHVEIDSKVGVGTTVRLYLPRAAEEPAEAAPPAPAEAAIATGEVVLVVEDNAEVRSIAVEALHELGYGVIEAADADQALERLDGHPDVKLLFTDVRMPGRLTGTELAREAVRRRPGLKVLYTSGYAGADVEVTPADVLQKPYRAQDLAERVHAVLHPAEAQPDSLARQKVAASA